MKEDKLSAFLEKIPLIEKKIGYTFLDKSLLRQAFTRTSFCNEAPRGDRPQSNEVLEFFGDSVLSLIIVSFFVGECTERCPYGIKAKWSEGDFSTLKSNLQDKANLSRSMAALGLAEYLLVGEGDAKLGIKNEPSVMEDLFESIIGAVYIDASRDIATVKGVVEGMLDMAVYKRQGAPQQNAKNRLQEWCADKARRLPAPIYTTLGEEGPDHKKVYHRGVYIGERLVASAKGKSFKLADLEAAALALEILKNEA